MAIVIYKNFGNIKDWGFKDQIQRAGVSISNNTAEGFERKSNKEFNQFLHIAKGSCGEVRSMLYIALELKYLSQNEFTNLYDRCLENSKIISGIIKAL